MIALPKDNSPRPTSPVKKELYKRIYCAYCGARIKGQNSWPHDDNCIMKK